MNDVRFRDPNGATLSLSDPQHPPPMAAAAIDVDIAGTADTLYLTCDQVAAVVTWGLAVLARQRAAQCRPYVSGRSGPNLR